jgi:hypothetical protein
LKGEWGSGLIATFKLYKRFDHKLIWKNMNKLMDELVKRLNTIEEKYGYLTFLIEERLTNEKLLQLEVMRIISKMPEVDEYLPEKPYNYRSKEKCDFWYKTSDSTEHWMEIKMRPTNYRKMKSKSKHGKAITHGVDSIIDDIKRLEEKAPKNSKKYALFAFFPMYPESYDKFNKVHLSKICKAADKKITQPNERIQVGDASFDLDLVEL